MGGWKKFRVMFRSKAWRSKNKIKYRKGYKFSKRRYRLRYIRRYGKKGWKRAKKVIKKKGWKKGKRVVRKRSWRKARKIVRRKRVVRRKGKRVVRRRYRFNYRLWRIRMIRRYGKALWMRIYRGYKKYGWKKFRVMFRSKAWRSKNKIKYRKGYKFSKRRYRLRYIRRYGKRAWGKAYRVIKKKGWKARKI